MTESAGVHGGLIITYRAAEDPDEILGIELGGWSNQWTLMMYRERGENYSPVYVNAIGAIETDELADEVRRMLQDLDIKPGRVKLEHLGKGMHRSKSFAGNQKLYSAFGMVLEASLFENQVNVYHDENGNEVEREEMAA